MQTADEHAIDELARRWEQGDESAAEELERRCLPELIGAADEDSARKWFSELRSHGPVKVGSRRRGKGSFLKWAVERVKVYAAGDPYRPFIEALLYDNDPSALEELVSPETREALTRAVSSYRKSLGDVQVEEVVEDFFLEFMSDWGAGRVKYVPAGGPFLAWAQQVVENRLKDELRRRGRRPTESLEDLSAEPGGPATARADARHNERSFEAAVFSALTPEQMSLIEICLEHPRLTQNEIGAELGWSPTKVTRVRNDARARTYRRMRQLGYRPEMEKIYKYLSDKKGGKGLMPMMFLRAAAPEMLDALRQDSAPGAAAARAGLASLSEEALWEMNADNGGKVREVAEMFAAAYRRASAVNPDHEFCSRVREVMNEPWGATLKAIINAGAAAPGPVGGVGRREASIYE